MARSRINRRRKNKRSRRKTRTQRGGANLDILANTGAPTNYVKEVEFNVKFFPNNALSASMFGNPLSIKQATGEPHVMWTKPAEGELRTFLCWDPDIAGASGKSEANNGFLHWLVINCKGTDPSTGTMITDWTPPSPPKDSNHRYIFGLFQQAAPITMQPQPAGPGFKIADFCKTNKLTPFRPYKSIAVNGNAA